MLFGEIMTKMFPNWMKIIIPQMQSYPSKNKYKVNFTKKLIIKSLQISDLKKHTASRELKFDTKKLESPNHFNIILYNGRAQA